MSWQKRLHHDVLKHAFFLLHDVDGGAVANDASLAQRFQRIFADVCDDEGNAIGAMARWEQLRAGPTPAFDAALRRAVSEGSRDAVAALERAYQELTHA